MEDVIHFGWINAEVSYAVMLSEMEGGFLSWFDTERNDRIRKRHAQWHSVPTKQNCSRGA